MIYTIYKDLYCLYLYMMSVYTIYIYSPYIHLFIFPLYQFSWSQVVVKATERYELHLKVLLTPTDPVAPLSNLYLLLLADFNLETFFKFSTLKACQPREEASSLKNLLRHAPPTPPA